MISERKEVFLSFLPLSHVFERTAGYYLAICIGAKVAFAENFSKIQENLVEIKPTIIVSVPRLYEKIQAGILEKMDKASIIKNALFNWATNISVKNIPYACTGKPREGKFSLAYGLADKLVFSKLKAALGMENLKFAASGGGPKAPG